MMETLACIGMLCASIGSIAEGDHIGGRQQILLDMLQYIEIPNIDGSELADQGYFAPRPWRSACEKYAASLLNGANLDKAAAWFKDEKNQVIAEWEMLMMLRAYYALKSNAHFIDSGARESVEQYLHKCLIATRTPGNKVNWKLDRYWGSENHKIVQFSERLLLEEFAGSEMDADIYDQVVYQVIMWCREKALRGYTEYCSPHYTERTLVPLLNIYDYTTDTDRNLKLWVQMAIDQLFAEYALFQINGFRGGAMRRCYQTDDYGYPNAELNDGRYDCMQPAGYVFFNNTDLLPITYRASDQSIIYMYLATTTYRPTPVHDYLANAERRGIVEFKSGRRWDHEATQPQEPDTCIYAWITPQYILSSIRAPIDVEWTGGVGSGVPYRISFHGNRAMIGTKVRVNDVPVEPDPQGQRPLFQHRNVLLYKGTVDTYRNTQPMIPRGRGIDHEESEGDYKFYREGDVYVGVLEKGGLGVIEARQASQYPSWEAFKADIKGNAAILNSERDVDYTTCDGVRIRLNGESVTVDGVEQKLVGWPLYESRLMRGDWLNQSEDAGLITVGDEEIGTLVLDFRDNANPRRKLTLPGE